MRKFEELVAHSVVFIVMLVLYFETKNFPDMNIGGSLGAEWWPQLILLLGMFMTLASAGFVARKQFGGDSGKTKVNREEVIRHAMSMESLTTKHSSEIGTIKRKEYSEFIKMLPSMITALLTIIVLVKQGTVKK